MDKLISVLRNPSTSIPHVHCCAFDASANHLILKKKIFKHIDEEKTLIAVATCKLAKSLPLLLQDLGEQFGAKKDNCKTIDSMMDFLEIIKEQNSKSNVILAIFGSEDLPSLGSSDLSAFLSIPSSYKWCRVLTVGDSPWGYCESTESLGSHQPVEIFIQEPIEKIENTIVTEISEKTKLEKQFVRLVFQSVSAQIQDKRLITKICIKAYEKLNKQNTSLTEREKISFITKSLPAIMNEVESRTLLKYLDSEEGSDIKILELPVLDQLLLLSAFCATHNSAAGDKRFFVKHHGREQRNENKERAVELAAEQKENGPKAADIQRVYFIFQVFLRNYKEDLEKTRKIIICPTLFNPLPQLASLENTSQVCRASSYANIDQPKIKCTISMESAKNIAKNLGIQLENYLERNI